MAVKKEITTEDRIRQLEQLVEALQDENAKKDAQLEQKEQEVKDIKAKGSGWLIITPNPAYDGNSAGVQFVNGMAFINKDREIPYFVIETTKETTMDKFGYTPAERKAIREREKMSSAERAVLHFENDMGYDVEFFDGQDDVLAKKLDERARERAALEAIQDRLAEEMERTHRPHYAGR